MYEHMVWVGRMLPDPRWRCSYYTIESGEQGAGGLRRWQKWRPACRFVKARTGAIPGVRWRTFLSRISLTVIYTWDVDPNRKRNKISLLLLYIRAKCAKNMLSVAKVIKPDCASGEGHRSMSFTWRTIWLITLATNFVFFAHFAQI